MGCAMRAARPLLPIRGELYSSERLAQFAESLAGEQVVVPGRRRGRPVLPRLLDNGRALLAAYRAIAAAIREESAISPAAEWLVDNFHIVEDQLREVRDDLPAGFYRQLPKLAAGPLAGYARVYGLAWGFVEHTDSRFDLDLFRGYVCAYQKVQPLTIGELWAAAISLRVVLVENLRRLVDEMVARRVARDAADALASMESQILEASRAGRIEGIVLRYGLFYGTHNPATEQMVAMVRRRMLPVVRGDHGLLPCIHVDDAVAATVAALDKGAPGQIYDIVDDRPVSMTEIVRAIAEYTGAPAPFAVPGWLPRLLAPFFDSVTALRLPLSNAKARTDLGWHPRFSTWRDGLAEMLAHAA